MSLVGQIDIDLETLSKLQQHVIDKFNIKNPNEIFENRLGWNALHVVATYEKPEELRIIKKTREGHFDTLNVKDNSGNDLAALAKKFGDLDKFNHAVAAVKAEKQSKHPSRNKAVSDSMFALMQLQKSQKA